MTEERITGRRAAHVDAVRQGRYISTQRWGYIVPLFVGSVAQLPPGRTPTETPEQLAARLEKGQVIQASIHSGSHYFRGRGSPMSSPTIYLWLDGDSLVVSDVAPVAMQDEGLRLASGTRRGFDRAAAEGEPPEDLYRGPIIPLGPKEQLVNELLDLLEETQVKLENAEAQVQNLGGLPGRQSPRGDPITLDPSSVRRAFSELDTLRMKLGGPEWPDILKLRFTEKKRPRVAGDPR